MEGMFFDGWTVCWFVSVLDMLIIGYLSSDENTNGPERWPFEFSIGRQFQHLSPIHVPSSTVPLLTSIQPIPRWNCFHAQCPQCRERFKLINHDSTHPHIVHLWQGTRASAPRLFFARRQCNFTHGHVFPYSNLPWSTNQSVDESWLSRARRLWEFQRTFGSAESRGCGTPSPH